MPASFPVTPGSEISIRTDQGPSGHHVQYLKVVGGRRASEDSFYDVGVYNGGLQMLHSTPMDSVSIQVTGLNTSAYAVGDCVGGVTQVGPCAFSTGTGGIIRMIKIYDPAGGGWGTAAFRATDLIKVYLFSSAPSGTFNDSAPPVFSSLSNLVGAVDMPAPYEWAFDANYASHSILDVNIPYMCSAASLYCVLQVTQGAFGGRAFYSNNSLFVDLTMEMD
jgi:hypothetical protein